MLMLLNPRPYTFFACLAFFALFALCESSTIAQSVEYDFITHPEVFSVFRPGSDDRDLIDDIAQVHPDEGLVTA